MSEYRYFKYYTISIYLKKFSISQKLQDVSWMETITEKAVNCPLTLKKYVIIAIASKEKSTAHQ